MRHDREGRGYDLLPQRSREEGDDVVIEALMKRSAVEGPSVRGDTVSRGLRD
jgi:hypothetical protein